MENIWCFYIIYNFLVLEKEKLRKRLSTSASPVKTKKSKKSDSLECSQSTKENTNDDVKPSPTKYRKTLSSCSFLKFICHVCKECSPNWSALKTHTKGEHGEKPRVYCVCEKILYTRHSINRHVVKHSDLGHKCNTCNKTFVNSKSLEAHSVVHMPKDQYPHICSQCSKRFATIFTLKIHEKTHLPKELRYIHSCETCHVKFPTKSSLKAHINAVHEKLRPFICDVCGHSFFNKGNLLEHRLLHSNEKMFLCPKCPKKFKTKGTLHRHIDCHDGTSYQCPQCPSILNSRRTLKMHMYIHETLCRYICAFCNKGFKRRKTLKTHMNLHTGERPYSCLWCHKTFADNSNCRIHKRRMHPNELADYEAIHGVGLELVNKERNLGERKVVYETNLKSIKTSQIVLPQLEIRPILDDP